MNEAPQQTSLFSYASIAAPRSRYQDLNAAIRLGLIGLCLALWSGLVVFRLYQLQISEHSIWRQSALKQHVSTVELASERAPILDRNNRFLAASVPAASVYIRPHEVRDEAGVRALLREEFGLDQEEIRSRLESEAPFVWVERQIPRARAQRITERGFKGVGFLLESRRFYPLNGAASTLLGKVGIDGHGLSGLEAQFEQKLRQEVTKTRVIRDGFGNTIEVPVSLVSDRRSPSAEGLKLTIDSNHQLILEEELEKGRENANAERVLGVLMDAHSGEILALGQSPAPNFNTLRIRSRSLLRNHVLETVFEPGSIMKPVVTALALEEGVTHPEEMIDCEEGAFRFGKHTINDVHPSSIITTHDVVVHSSNIGMTKLGLRLGKERLYSGLKQFQFGQPVGLGFPGEASGILRKVESWAAVDVATHSFGQGVAVTPLQVVRAISTIANGGRLVSPHVLYGANAAPTPRVLSLQTAQAVSNMMVGVVSDEGGTGSRARIAGLRVGGKTGTAQRPREDGRGYEPGAYISSFVGFADGTNIGVHRTLTLLVVVDRPDTNSIYGGTLAAPVFQRVMQRVLHSLSTSWGAEGSGNSPYNQENGSVRFASHSLS